MSRLPRLLAIAAALASWSCSSSSTHKSMTVAVRDGLTREPVAGALVRARSVHFFLPLGTLAGTRLPLMEADPILDPFPPHSARGTTGEDGTVRLKVIIHHPVQIIVIAKGHEPVFLYLPKHPAIAGESDWMEAGCDPARPGGPGKLQLQFRP